ncbi:hypothetical protein [Marinomonas mediterranea]|uniref:hypothetical protein n=1 Tax=Marinomonas mediterranea TaxID=119864 RepID=UPI00234AA204|nr:hypothetical protein [Marinomonas mediterranea]WCN07715.1 hypothetical protein GV055_01635 [Marinomonas mediterranea]WCN11816.1 hypothetical protein GV054_01660 [Marinomonas mediterranea]
MTNIKFLSKLSALTVCCLLAACTQTQLTPASNASPTAENTCIQEELKSPNLQFNCGNRIIAITVDAENSSPPGMFDKENGQWTLALSFEAKSSTKPPLTFDFTNAKLTRDGIKIAGLDVDDSITNTIRVKSSVTGTEPVFVSGIKVSTELKQFELNTIEIKLDYNELTLGKFVLEVLAHSAIILGS